MIIVYPDYVVGTQQGLEMLRKVFVDPEIAAEIAAGKFRKVEPVMQDWPQHAVGKAVVEFLVVVFAQIYCCVGNIVLRDRFQRAWGVFGNAAAPAEPEAAVPLQRRPDCHFKPAGSRAAIRNANS